MTTGKRSVVVKILPASSDLRQQRLFLEEVKASLEHRRPRLVLDCSLLRELNAAAMQLMLHCLEEALKRNGDVRLASIPIASEPAFAAARLGRLFNVYRTAAEAVASFHQGPMASEPSTVAVAALEAAPAT